MADAWLRMTAAELGRRIAAGKIGAVELTEAYLDAIAAHPFAPRIYARTTAARARAEAMAAHDRAKAGLRRGPLDGVPISWKDLFDSAGVATEAGSALLAGRTPERDARVLANATLGGLVCLGKTHMTELAFSGLGLNPITETPPCINDHDAVPGGSSSGAATSVAFGLAAAGIGSDTGGSVRVPAAWNDLVGLKTTAGRVSCDGVVPLCPRFDTVGPLCRSVEDAALLLAALEGGHPADLRGAELSGVRFMVLSTIATDGLRPEPAQGFERALGKLSAAGAKIETHAAPEVAEAMALAGTLYAPEAYGIWRDAIEAHPEKMYPPVRDRFRGGASVLAADYVAGWARLDGLRHVWNARVAGYDAVLVPSVPNLPPKAQAVAADEALFVSENLLALRNTRIGNLLGLPGLTLSTGVPSTGITLLGKPFAEEALLRVGAAVEVALR